MTPSQYIESEKMGSPGTTNEAPGGVRDGEAADLGEWLREIDGGTDNACWVVCSKGDPGAVWFVPDQQARIDRLEFALLHIAEKDWHCRTPPKPRPDGGMRGWAGHRAVWALTGLHGSYVGDAEVRNALGIAAADTSEGQGQVPGNPHEPDLNRMGKEPANCGEER